MTDEDLMYQYFSAPEGHVWQWSEEFVEWNTRPKEETICHFTLVQRCVSALSTYDLPPLGSILAIISLSRPDWNREVLEKQYLEHCDQLGFEEGWKYKISKIFVLLESLQKHFDKGAVDKTVSLCELLFRNPPSKIGYSNGKRIQNPLTNFRMDTLGEYVSQDSPGELFKKELHSLWEALKSFLASQASHTLKTGISTPVEELELALPESDEGLSIGSLLKDHQFAALARLVQQLLAVMNLPKKIEEASELPVGGLSDISNRGQLDKLLLSELAHDEMTMAVRLANNESLYYKRESPSEDERKQTLIFLDNGIRYWGQARLFSNALALTLRLKKVQDEDLQLFLHKEGEFKDLALESKDDLSSLMGELEKTLSPQKALEKFFLKRTKSVDKHYFIFHQKTATPTLRQFLRQQLTEFTLCLISGKGDLEIQRIHDRGTEKILSKTLNLEDFLKEEVIKKDIKRQASSDLPVFYTYVPLPFSEKSRSGKLVMERTGKTHSLEVRSSGKLYLVAHGIDRQDFQVLLSQVPCPNCEVHLHQEVAYLAFTKEKRVCLWKISRKTSDIEKVTLATEEKGHKSIFFQSDSICVLGEGGNNYESFDLESDKKNMTALPHSLIQNFYTRKKTERKIAKQFFLNSFKSVAYHNDDNSLIFYTTKGQQWKLSILGLTKLSQFIKASGKTEFVKVEKEGLLLRKAIFQSGAEVLIDHGGYIHLKDGEKELSMATAHPTSSILQTRFWNAATGHDEFDNVDLFQDFIRGLK